MPTTITMTTTLLPAIAVTLYHHFSCVSNWTWSLSMYATCLQHSTARAWPILYTSPLVTELRAGYSTAIRIGYIVVGSPGAHTGYPTGCQTATIWLLMTCEPNRRKTWLKSVLLLLCAWANESILCTALCVLRTYCRYIYNIHICMLYCTYILQVACTWYIRGYTVHDVCVCAILLFLLYIIIRARHSRHEHVCVCLCVCTFVWRAVWWRRRPNDFTEPCALCIIYEWHIRFYIYKYCVPATRVYCYLQSSK